MCDAERGERREVSPRGERDLGVELEVVPRRETGRLLVTRRDALVGGDRGDRLGASVRYDAVVDAAVALAGAMKYQTLEALGEAVAIGLLRRFALIDTITVGVSKFSPPIPHTLSKVGIAVRLARSDLAVWPTEGALEAFA